MAATLETRLAEVLMSALAPCDLGDDLEVVHDVEVLEIEMECSVDEDDDDEPDPGDTMVDVTVAAILAQDLGGDLEDHGTAQFVPVEEIGTHQFVRFSAPYERIEIQLDVSAFRRATIEEAKKLQQRTKV